MKKAILGLTISLFLTLVPALSSSAVEFGQDATGDPNAVKVNGASGFLYSERIVLTVGHVIESTGGLAWWDRDGVIYKPGIVSISGQKKYGVKRFVRDKSKVELVGYGFIDGSQRNRPWEEIINRSPNKLTSTLMSPEMVIEFYRQYPNVDWKQINKPGVYGIVQHRELKQSHICDGDSGSMFFVEEDNVRYLLGTTGLGLIFNNCPPPERSYPYPSMSWIDPNSKLRDMLKTAEKIVEEDKKREFVAAEEVRLATELKAKQEAEAKAALSKKITITCAKGKLSKKVTAVKPKCPAGYKKK